MNSATKTTQALKPRSNVSFSLRTLALLFDFGSTGALFFALFGWFRVLPLLELAQALSFAVLAMGVWLGQRFIFGITLGERLWRLKVRTRFRFRSTLYQGFPLTSWAQGVGTFLTIFSFAIAGFAGYWAVVFNPAGMPVSLLEWEIFFPSQSEAPAAASLEASAPDTATPPSADSEDRWTVIPFFYSLGAWPKTFQGHDVFYSLPYEKGPPERFAGQIQARWAPPQTRVTIEGPKSPLREDKTPYDRDDIADCLINFGDSELARTAHCLVVRSAVLSRHMDALSALSPNHWEMSWVAVSNPALPEDQELEGILISARNRDRGQDRFVLITARGTHQTFVLDYPMNDTGKLAQETFRKTLRSLRVSDDLNPGRAWVDQSIEKVDLREITHLGQTEQAVHRLAEIQALLVARISVDPKTYETYYHLAGTALMLARAGVSLKQPEILGMAKPLVQSAQHYAQDVLPQDKRNTLLQAFWTEAQKM